MDEHEQLKIKASVANQFLHVICETKFKEIYEKNIGSKVSAIFELFCCWIMNNHIK